MSSNSVERGGGGEREASVLARLEAWLAGDIYRVAEVINRMDGGFGIELRTHRTGYLRGYGWGATLEEAIGAALDAATAPSTPDSREVSS